MILHFFQDHPWKLGNVARSSRLGILIGLFMARLDYRESNNRQVVQSWYLSRRHLEPRMVAYFKIKLL